MLAKNRDFSRLNAVAPAAPLVEARPRIRQPRASGAARVLSISSDPVRLVAEACLRELPDAYRAVLELHEIQALALSDVAGRLSISPDLAAARLGRARQMLAQALCRRSLPRRVTP